ncbi:MAG TPA: GNAT family N-acetyltransferase [Streptosporangiaceae bacterium]|nr:GNAT family N-acetyltransferase [Streptosporangiaceae bacterium]
MAGRLDSRRAAASFPWADFWEPQVRGSNPAPAVTCNGWQPTPLSNALAYATRVRSGPELLEFGKARFLAELDALIDVYTAAMHPPQQQLPGRRSIMERHAQFPSFRSVVMTQQDGPTRAPADPRARSGGRPYTIVGFAYGFHGTDGQWWHDLVRRALTNVGGYDLAQTWLGDSFEVAEVHVHPDYQGRGIGRVMVPALVYPRLERTALLSTADTDSRARRLYRGLGFSDLLTGYRFPGTDPPYAVMGAVLPLRPGSAPTARGNPAR